MLGRQSVRVTYAHKRKRLQNASKMLLSSPLEVLPPDMDDLTRTQMARRMLKRSRRVAFAEQLEDKNVEHIREHLAKRIKRTQERVSDSEPTEAPFDVSPKDDLAFQTPFPSSQSVNESAVAETSVPEQLSPVPVAKRVMSRTISRNLKENTTHSQILASPFSSRPGSAASSPKHKSGRQSSRRVSRIPRHAKSRTLSGVFKEDTRRVLQKDSTVSLRDTKGEPSTRHIKHQRYPSSPSTAYMRSQFAQEDWIAPPKAFSRTFDDSDDIPSPGGSVLSDADASFYADQPQSCSTPAISRLRKLPDPHGRQARTDSFLENFSLRKESTEAGVPDVEMVDATVLPRRQTIHLSGNSIFSSSDEFTIRSLPATHDGGTTAERNNVTGRDEALTRVASQVPSHREAIGEPQAGHSLAGSFVAEYDIPLPDLDYSPASTAATKMLGSEGVPKSSVGQSALGLPGTSPACGENLVIRASRNPGVPRSSVGERLLALPGTSPARGENLVVRASRKPRVSKSSVGERPLGLRGRGSVRGQNLVIRTSRNPGTLTPPASPPNKTATCPPSSPASDLALELQSVDIRGDPDTHSDGETRHPSASIPLQTRSHSLQDVPAESTTKKSVQRRPVRNRAGTIRASDFAKPGALSGVVPGLSILPQSNVRRTRSGTVVGPDSKLAAKGAGLPAQAAKGTPATRLAAVQSESGSESDDELLLKGPWTEDLVYLGIPAPRSGKDAEADELNLGGPWHSLESGPPRRLGLRRR